MMQCNAVLCKEPASPLPSFSPAEKVSWLSIHSSLHIHPHTYIHIKPKLPKWPM